VPWERGYPTIAAMAAPKGEETALGSARGRFIESLPRKAIELRGAIALLSATPAAEGPREDMRRRLHTLYASALVFRNDVLAAAVKEGLELLDAARDEKRSLGNADLDALTRLVKRLPELRGELPIATHTSASSTRPTSWSGAPQARNSAIPLRDSRTLTGLAPVGSPSSPPAQGSEPGASVPPAGSVRPSTSAAASSAAMPATSQPIGGAMRAASTPAALGAQSSHRAPLLQMVVHVLALARPEELLQLRSLLPAESFELTAAASLDQALSAARSHAPDVVLADRDLAIDGDLIRRLRSDPLTDFVPVVLVQSRVDAIDALTARDAGADDVLLRPLDTESVTRALGAVTGTLLEESTGLSRLGDATLDEVAERVAEEIRRGIVDAAERGRELKIPLGEGAEVLAAAWAAVARVRAFVAQQSGGRVRFADRPRRGGPALLALVGGETDEDPLALVGTLTGRRVLVVDDDPAVVWFFAGLLREEGATVIETTDGREALRAARTERPDVVISDILMPHLDGFALCRELKRDPALADVPVILISWKEDLLHRMRELSAGASGYLRKEAGAAQILGRVREVLRPRTQLEGQLKAGGEVRGSLEGTGVVPLLRSVRRARTSARVTIRDAWNLFECEIRDGRLAQLTRTASDGSFSRGERALPQLLGANAGRFVVNDSETVVRSMFEGTLDDALHRGARTLGAMIDAVSGPSLMKTERVGFDEEAYPVVLKQSPGPVREIVERLHAGEAPSMLLATGVSAQTLESVLMDLARRGAVREVRGKGGEDLVSVALKSRENERPTQLATPFSIIPPAPNPVISVRPEAEAGTDRPAERGLPTVLDPFASFAAITATTSIPSRLAEGAPATQESATRSLSPSGAIATDTLGSPSVPASVQAASEPPKSETNSLPVPSLPPVSSMPPPPSFTRDDDEPTDQFDPMSRDQAQHILDAAAKRNSERAKAEAQGEPAGEAKADPVGADKAEPVGSAEASRSEAAIAAEADDLPPALDDGSDADVPARPSDPPPQVSESARESARERAAQVAAEANEFDAMASDDRRSRGTLAGWALALLGLVAIAFYAERAYELTETRSRGLVPIGDRRPGLSTSDSSNRADAVEAAPAQPGKAPDEATPTPIGPNALPRAGTLVAPEDSGFTVHQGILDPSIPVSKGQGLLVVDAPLGMSAGQAQLTVDNQRVGNLPAKVALAEGVHELVISRGDRQSYRYVSVHAGKSWVLREP